MLNYIIPVKRIAKMLLFRQGLSLPTMLCNKQSMQLAHKCFFYSSSFYIIYSFIDLLFFGFFFSEECFDKIHPYKCISRRTFGMCSSELGQQKMIEECPKTCDFCGKLFFIFKEHKNRTRLKNQEPWRGKGLIFGN